MQDKWYTPVEFEMACGVTSSKDWGRNITYAGHPLHQLIRAGIIAAHVVSTHNAIVSLSFIYIHIHSSSISFILITTIFCT